MKEIIIDTLLDVLKLIPFLFIAFLIIELIEHKLSNKSTNIIKKSGKFSVIIGSILGIFPQCGFSVIATNLYATRIISLGTLIAIYLSTSDEMLPILISNNVSINLILKILSIKIIIGIICGFIIDLLYRKKEDNIDYHICQEEHCHCEDNLIISSIKHTFNIVLFILIINFILNIGFYYLGDKIILKDNFFAPFITSLIGLIPNCGASVMITSLYLNNVITFNSLISGLLTGSGVAILVLFRTNKNIKENILVLSLIYIIGVLSGIIINLF